MELPMRILIVAPAWVGDMVMAHALVQVLRQRHPGCEVHLLAPPSTASLGRRMDGVAQVHLLDIGHGVLGLGRRWKAGRALLRLAFDKSIVLPNSLKSALVPWFARIPIRSGWLGEQRYGVLSDVRVLDRQAYPLQVEQFVALGLPVGAVLPAPIPDPRLHADPEAARALVQRLGLSLAKPVTILCPGAEFGPAKKWPERHYAAVARHIVSSGGEVWLMGSPNDAPAGEAIKSACGDAVHQLAGKTTLVEAIDLMSLAARVICNDSGLMHVAAALGIPVIAIYGSTSADFTPPLTSRAQIVRNALPCSPCFQRECPLGHLDCLQKLLPERVIGLL